jgi:hypothetical protein
MVEKLTYRRIRNSLHYRLFKLLSNFINVHVPGTLVYPGRVLGDGNWGTHNIPLIAAVINSEGPILELGAGDYSTPLLHALCKKNKRFLHSTDTDKKWLDLFIDLETPYHQFTYVPVFEDDCMLNPNLEKWDSIGIDHSWGVVLVDHRPAERRRVDIARLKNNTNIFVVHDSEQLSYEYENVFSMFKYRYDYTRYKSRTTLLSDKTDVSSFFNEQG